MILLRTWKAYLSRQNPAALERLTVIGYGLRRRMFHLPRGAAITDIAFVCDLSFAE